jgi:SH3 domain protein
MKMKSYKTWIGIFAILLIASSVSAKAMYVNDLIKLMVRSGRGLDNRILAVIESGDTVDVLEAGEQWSRVRTASGKEGWVLTRYLTDEETASRRLARLETAHEATVAENEVLKTENQQLTSENNTLAESLQQKTAEFEALRQEHEMLRRESAEFLQLKGDFARASARLEELQKQNQRFSADMARLDRSQNIRWFIVGASVLLVGFVIGVSSRRKRRKPSLL